MIKENIYEEFFDVKKCMHCLCATRELSKLFCLIIFSDLPTWSNLTKVSKNSSKDLFTSCLLGIHICDPKKLNSLTSAF